MNGFRSAPGHWRTQRHLAHPFDMNINARPKYQPNHKRPIPDDIFDAAKNAINIDDLMAI